MEGGFWDLLDKIEIYVEEIFPIYTYQANINFQAFLLL